MIIGVIVFTAADSAEELNYAFTDLHASWGLCVSVGILCIAVCVWGMVRHVRGSRNFFYRGYLPINDDDEELIEI